jgi:hypothetical protein
MTEADDVGGCLRQPDDLTTDSRARARSVLKGPSSSPDVPFATMSPVNSTPCAGNQMAMLPSVCPGWR